MPWSSKLTDVPGLMGLAGQTIVDIGVLIGVYLPTFYVFKVRHAPVASMSACVRAWDGDPCG